MTASDGSGPLSGITVVSLEQAVSAPLCSRQLADLGARVIKIERPGNGDFTRDYDESVRGLSAYFVWLNRNKESLALDLAADRGRLVLARLLETADVFIQNLAPGACARLGFGSEQLRERFPRLITVDISGYGEGGTHSERRAYDLLVQAEGGSCAMTGRGAEVAKPGIPVADVGAGSYAVSGVLAALFNRERTGVGASLSVAMIDVIADWMGFALNQSLHTHVDPVPVGLGSPLVAPYAGYATADGHTIVLGTTNDGEWRRLATSMLLRPDLAANPAYERNIDRVARRAELDEVIGAWVARHTLAEVQAAADAARIGHARLNAVADVVAHPDLAARGRWSEVETPVGSVPSLKQPISSSGWPTRMDAVPAVGQHNAAILIELGLGQQEGSDG